MVSSRKKIGVLVCDDSALMRRTLKKIVELSPDMYVIGTANDGEDAVLKARELKPDVVTMDIRMPQIDGITALQIITEEKIAPVIMISVLTKEGAVSTFEALELGAFDYVTKPDGTLASRMESAAQDIIDKIKAAARPGTMRRLTRTNARESRTKPLYKYKSDKKKIKVSSGIGFKAVALGISTGGPKTIFDVLPLLSKDLNAAIFMVQHMPAKFITSYVRRIDSHCALKCVETEAGLEVEPGTVYIGKGGYHLTVYKKLNKKLIIRASQKPEHTFMPSIDIMMNSVYDVFEEDTIGVLMTGMGKDGAEGMVKIKDGGGFTIAESEESAIVFGMPQEAIALGGATQALPSWDIAEAIIKAVN